MLNQHQRERRLPEHHLICVFEAVNETLKEIYLGSSRHLIGQLIRDFDARFPRAARHWRKDHRIFIRCLEYSIQAGEAGAFIEAHAERDDLKGWKVLRDASREAELGARRSGRARARKAARRGHAAAS